MANRVHCTNCDRDGHAAWQCARPKKSTAARKDVREPKGSPSKSLQVGSALAGTQVQSVDTNPAGPRGLGAGHIPPVRGAGNEDRSSEVERPSVANAGNVGGAIPSGLTRFDKAVWMREHMPAYMRKYRADVKAGVRIPKPREGGK